MEACYAKLQQDGKNDVEKLIKWLKDSQVIDQSKEHEDKVRSYFAQNIPLDKFKEVLQKLADEFNTSLDEITKKLADTCPGLPSFQFPPGCHGPCTERRKHCQRYP